MKTESDIQSRQGGSLVDLKGIRSGASIFLGLRATGQLYGVLLG